MVVFIDGAATGSVAYNQCRGTIGNPVPGSAYCNDDVANIFGNPTPQPPMSVRTSNATRFRNLDAGRAAIGAFQIDTTLVANGLHTLAWGVTDSAGRAEGIGSRYFTVLNTGADVPAPGSDRTHRGDGGPPEFHAKAEDPGPHERASAAWSPFLAHLLPDIVRAALLQELGPALPRGDARALTMLSLADAQVWSRRGLDLQQPFDQLVPGEDGARRVEIPDLGRLELWLGPVETGYLVANGTLRDLPPGSHLDAGSGQFTWMPGPGYLGTYTLVFLRDGRQIPVEVTIRPGHWQAGFVR
jgi:hypothetical protein